MHHKILINVPILSNGVLLTLFVVTNVLTQTYLTSVSTVDTGTQRAQPCVVSEQAISIMMLCGHILTGL